jgi:conjugative transfer signal peptidase TraF
LRGATAGIALAGIFWAQPYRLAINTTASEPEGWYLTRRLDSGAPLHRGELVVMRYAGPAVAKYRTVAPYPAGTKFIKRIAGIPGDKLDTSGRHVALTTPEGRTVSLGILLAQSPSGKPVPTPAPWRGTRIPTGRYYLASTDTRVAFDSRYFGLMPRQRILAEAWPIWTWKKPAESKAKSISRIGPDGVR